MFAASKTASVSGGYQISRSLRFNSPDSAYLNRTPASSSNLQTWTWSGWVKRSKLGAQQTIIGYVSSGGSYQHQIEFSSGDNVNFYIYDGGVTTQQLTTTQVFRDVSAWYHLVVVQDTTQATSSNRAKIYVNGVQVISFGTALYPSQNYNGFINSVVNTGIGAGLPYGLNYYSGYLTELYLIDGQALTPSSFGQTDAQTGVWQPKAYSGSYGTNGFYLNFSDNSNTTAATLGKDYSGNGNNWTPNNFSVTAGIGNDSLTDTPTNNFATLNPLEVSTTYATISNGNLQYVDTTVGGSYRAGFSTVFASSGKYYFEAIYAAVSGSPATMIGLASPTPQNDVYIEQTITGYQGYGYLYDGTKATNDTYTAFGATYTAGDTISVAVDIDAGKVWFAKNGTWQASGDPAAGTNPAFNIVTGRAYGFAVQNGSSVTSAQIDANFGQRAFLYTPPSGFSSLCTNNLATPTIGATTATQAGKYFNTILWTGNGSNPRAVTGVGFQPDFSWLARRDVGYGFWLYDAVRGATKFMASQSTAAESTYTQLNSFDSDGFTQAGGVDQGNNISGGSYVAWNWKANGSGSTNTSGSITSTVSANTTSGFSVVTYTGTGSNATVGHGLGVAPSMVICKARTGTSVGAWQTYHSALGATKTMFLNLTDAAYTNSLYWNNTAPTSSVFSLGGNTDGNGSGYTMVAYCFAEISGYSKFGSYTGNGSADGPFVFTGMRPAYVLIKKTSATDEWFVWDSKRSTINQITGGYLMPNNSGSEGTVNAVMDLVSNGFKIRGSDTSWNLNGATYIFAAFAEAPFKYSLAR